VLAGIDDELYLIFQSAITGRASFNEVSPSLMDMAPADSKELRRLRQAVTAEGIMQSIFGLLRQLPKRLLMVLKLKSAPSPCCCLMTDLAT
jgi:aarF domain-containing kinase